MESPLNVEAEEVVKELSSKLGEVEAKNIQLTLVVKQLVEHANSLQEKLNQAAPESGTEDNS